MEPAQKLRPSEVPYLRGLPCLKEPTSIPVWSSKEEKKAYYLDVRLFNEAVRRMAKELDLTNVKVLELIRRTYGEEYSMHGILEMKWKQFQRDIKRTLRLKTEETESGALSVDYHSEASLVDDDMLTICDEFEVTDLEGWDDVVN